MAGISNPSGATQGMVNPMEALAPAGITRRTLPGWMNTDTTTRDIVSGQLIYAPILVPRVISYDRMTLEVISGVPGLIRVGIYRFAVGLPTALVLDAGTIDTTLAGIKDLVLGPEIIQAGFYFVALVPNVVVTLRAIGPEGSLSWAPPVAGLTNLTDMMFEFCVLAASGQVGLVAGGLPALAVAPNSIEKVDHIHVCMRET